MELQDIYDKDGNKTGKIIERGKEARQHGEYILIVDVWIMNSKSEFLISKRASSIWRAGKWQATTGCAISGDDSLSAALRETKEELGIVLNPANGKMIERATRNEDEVIIDAWLFCQDIDINDVVLQPDETDDATWAMKDDILRLVDEDKFLGDDRQGYEEFFQLCGA